jgi:hypothetical protein
MGTEGGLCVTFHDSNLTSFTGAGTVLYFVKNPSRYWEGSLFPGRAAGSPRGPARRPLFGKYCANGDLYPAVGRTVRIDHVDRLIFTMTACFHTFDVDPFLHQVILYCIGSF